MRMSQQDLPNMSGRVIIRSELKIVTQFPQISCIVNELGTVRLYIENGTYIGYTEIQQHVRTRSEQELCSVHARQQSKGPSAPLEGFSPMASVGKAHS